MVNHIATPPGLKIWPFDVSMSPVTASSRPLREEAGLVPSL